MTFNSLKLKDNMTDISSIQVSRICTIDEKLSVYLACF